MLLNLCLLFFISIHLPLSSLDGFSLLDVCLHRLRLDRHDQDNDDRLEYRSLCRRDTKSIQGCSDCLNCIGADDGTRQIESSASKAVAAKSYRENGVHLKVETDVVGVGGGDPGCVHYSGYACKHAAQHIGQEYDLG